MKQKVHALLSTCILFCLLMFCVTCVPVLHSSAAENEIEQPTVLSGWQKDAGGKRYYINGKPVSKIKKIDDVTYGFNSKGYLVINNWVKQNGKVYHTNKKGVIYKDKHVKINDNYYYFRTNGTRFSGWKTVKDNKGTRKYYFKTNGVRIMGRVCKINGKYYFFNKKGILQSGYYKEGEYTIWTDSNGVLEGWKKSNKYYNGRGKSMSKVERDDFDTTERAYKIAMSITNNSMSQAAKLKACYDWVIKKYYVTRRNWSNFDGWPAVYANDHFIYGGGTCMADAAAFAYLAKAIGYTNVYVATDCARANSGAHGWTEINGKVYDPLFSEAKGYYNYYGINYSSYYMSVPILHIKIS